MILCHRTGAIDAVAHLNAVQIDFDNALLRPHQFDEGGEIDLETLTQPRTTRPEEHVLGRLLRDGTGSVLRLLRVFHIAHGSLLNGLEVETVMLQEASILRRHHSQG